MDDNTPDDLIFDEEDGDEITPKDDFPYEDFPKNIVFNETTNLRAREQLLSGGFIPVPNSLVGELPPRDLLVLGYLLSCIRKEGHGRCHPSRRTIAKNLGCALRLVHDALSSLREHKILTWRPTRFVNAYFLRAPGVPVKVGTAPQSQTNLKHKAALLKHGFLPVPRHVCLVDGISFGETLTLSYLLKCIKSARKPPGMCRPQPRSITKYTGCPRRTVFRSLQRLRHRGLVSQIPIGPVMSCLYFVHLSAKIVDQIRTHNPAIALERTKTDQEITDEMGWQTL